MASQHTDPATDRLGEEEDGHGGDAGDADRGYDAEPVVRDGVAEDGAPVARRRMKTRKTGAMAPLRTCM